MTNSSTTAISPTTDAETSDAEIPIKVKITVLSIIMVLALLGNCILIFSITRTRNMLKSVTNVFILNLACCDIIVVTTSVIGDIVYLTYDQFVFGEVGCHMLYPVSTYAVIAAVSSLLLICVDRYIATSYPFRYRHLKSKSKYVLVCSHLFSIGCVIPYAVYSSLTTGEDGVTNCGETWSETSGYVYTIFLFLVQYGVPLPIIISLYLRTWIQIKTQNDIIIRNAENRLRRIESNGLSNTSSAMTQDGSQTENNNNINKKSSTNKREKNHSELYVARHTQTVHMLKLFICIVIVFAVCMLPHHIKWLYYAATNDSVGDVPDTVFYWLTYTNSVCNPFIYGIHPKFRKVYSHTVKSVANGCFQREGSSSASLRSAFSLTETMDFSWIQEILKRKSNFPKPLSLIPLESGEVLAESHDNNQEEKFPVNNNNKMVDRNDNTTNCKGVSLNSYQSCRTASTELRYDEKGGSFNSSRCRCKQKSVKFSSSELEEDDVFWTRDENGLICESDNSNSLVIETEQLRTLSSLSETHC